MPRSNATPVYGVQIVARLEELTRRLKRTAFERLDDLGVTPAQARLLELLQREGGRLRPVQIAGRLDIAARSVTSLLDGLEHGAFIERIPDRRDRRAVLVQLTPGGRAVVRVALTRQSAMAAELINRLTHDEQQHLLHLLSRIGSE